jgi:hypothetical protein
MSVQLQKHYFTVDEYYLMAESGVFAEDDRLELIEGEVIEMGPIGSRQSGCVNRLNKPLHCSVGELAILSVQNPIRQWRDCQSKLTTSLVNGGIRKLVPIL